MSSDLRELFEQDVDFEPPHDLAERAVHGARTRRRNRLMVGGAVLATVVVVLGVVIGSGQLRSDSEPRPTDVAAIPNILPSADSGPTLRPGDMQAASAAYLVDGAVALVDAGSGEVATVRPLGSADRPVRGAVGIALSPDGRSLVIDFGSHLAILAVESASISNMRGLRPVDDSGATTVMRPSVYAWENDSSHFICSCAVEGGVPELVRVSDDGTAEPVDSTLSPLQVASGSGGAAVQVEANGGPWFITRLDGSKFVDDGPVLPSADALAMSRGRGADYLAIEGDGFTIGNMYETQPVATGDLVAPPGVFDFSTIIGVEAARDGYVVTTAAGVAWPGDKLQGADEIQVQGAELVFVSDQGEQQVISSLPLETEDASIASDLVGAPATAPIGSLPNALPSPDRLPFLTAGAVEVASAAYVADSALVVVDAAGGAAYVVDALAAGLERATDSRPVFGAKPELSLSPDGRYLVVAVGGNEDDAPLSFFDVAQARFATMPVALTSIGETPIPSARMTWSADSTAFLCVCSSPGEIRQLQILDVAALRDGGDGTVLRGGVRPSQLAAGPMALVGLFDRKRPRWEPIPAADPDATEPPAYGLAWQREAADMMLLGPDSSSYLRWWTGGQFEMHVPENGQSNYTDQRWLAGVWGADGPVVVTYSKGDLPSKPLEVSYVEWDGESGWGAGVHEISTLPAGTTAAAFSGVAAP